MVNASLVVSIVSVVIALAALPTSYFIAVRQVRIGLEEQDRRNNRAARLRLANAIDEFRKVFGGITRDVCGVAPGEPNPSLELVNARISEIDARVRQTSVLAHLATAINDLSAVGYAGLPPGSDAIDRLLSMRVQAELGTDAARNATAGVYQLCPDDSLSAALRSD
jgi:hypothetical protein